MFSRLISRAPLVVVGSASAALAAHQKVAACSGDKSVPISSLDWPHHGALAAYDTASIRRGFQVYRQICASCHSVNQLRFMQLVGVTHDEAGMTKVAASYEVEDGPNDEGEMFGRPGRLSDKIPGPYKNDAQARAANNGALPPDLSLLVKARFGGADYIFQLLTGYVDAPAGRTILPGLHYNPYFSGGAIAMAKQLSDGQVDYEDGTPSTESQMAKDVAAFLAWAAEPEHDERKYQGFKFLTVTFIALLLAGYHKRFKWSVLKSRKVSYVAKPK